MTEISFNGNACIFEDNEGRKSKIFDISYLKNRSSFSIYNFNSSGQLVPEFPQFFKNVLEEIDVIEPKITNYKKLELIITISLIIKQFFYQPLDYRILEVGCDHGTLSYFVAKVLSAFDDKSQLLCLTDQIVNTTQDEWLSKISLLKNTENISRLTTSYDVSWLDQPVYDLIIINGNVDFQHSDRVMKSCLAALKKGGSLICLPANDSFLAESFRLGFSKVKAYNIAKNSKVLTTTPVKQDYELTLANDPQVKFTKAKELLISTVAYLENNLDSNANESLKKSIDRLIQTEKAINACQNAFKQPEIKNKVNILKEVLVNCYVGNYQNCEQSKRCCIKAFQALKQVVSESSEFNY
ncbi:hypothetical protein [Liquorilactobacillus sicerae]|uniref:hypothetical protein n=1 Tax=Liquorilactobacillus sicerae TaxID=1416943 RepID=UPI002480B29B|nr:hypothetical protein [Liquorilactobacillus sicerae]